MNMRKLMVLAAVPLVIAAGAAGQPPAITGITCSTNSVALQWDIPTNRFIVERFDSLMEPSLCWASSTGATQDAIEMQVGQATSLFFRLQFGLQTVAFLDPNLTSAVRDAISAKHLPTNAIYDIDLIGITYLSCVNRGINNLNGISALVDLTRLHLDLNQVTDVRPLADLMNL